jgi:hypothetical protein
MSRRYIVHRLACDCSGPIKTSSVLELRIHTIHGLESPGIAPIERSSLPSARVPNRPLSRNAAHAESGWDGPQLSPESPLPSSKLPFPESEQRIWWLYLLLTKSAVPLHIKRKAQLILTLREA